MLTFRSCLLFVLAACGPTAPVSTDTAGGEASTDPPATTATSTTADPTTSGAVTSGQSSGAFVGDPDMGGATFIDPQVPCGEERCTTKDCDPWGQNCPEGEKCSPWSADGDSAWDSNRCVPIARTPGHPGDPCTVEGSGVSGIDSCDLDSMCWDVDEATLTGTCVLRCAGGPDDPICPPDHGCMIANEGVLNLCLPSCDPLAQDCPGDDLCLPAPHSADEFLCFVDGSGDEGQVFDTCEFANDCDAGLLCADPALASECDPNAGGCCLPFCDTTAPPSCPGAMQQCLPWFTDDPAPTGLENLGVCALPP